MTFELGNMIARMTCARFPALLGLEQPERRAAASGFGAGLQLEWQRKEEGRKVSNFHRSPV
jgi:hypothetical protein